MADRGDDAGRAVGGRGDHAATGGIFLVDRQRVQVHPVEDGQRVLERRFGLAAQFLQHGRRAARNLQAAGQHAR